MRRLKLCPLLLKKIRQLNRSPCQGRRETLRGLDVLSASLLRQNLADCMLSSTSVALSCSPRHKVTETLLWLCVDVSVLLMVGDCLLFCLPVQSWQSWRSSWMSQVQPAPSPTLRIASWRRVSGLVTAVSYEMHHCFCCVRVSIPSESLKFRLF